MERSIRNGSMIAFGCYVTVDDVWRLSMLQPADKTQNVGYPTQKPEPVLERILESASSPGDLVADFFCGSGTTLAVAEKLGRRWVGCDLGRWGIHVTRKRLLGIEDCKPFEVLNLGKYERQYWQAEGVGVGTAKTDPPKPIIVESVQERLAFDIAIPITKPRLVHDIRKLSDLDVAKLEPIFEQEDLAEVYRIRLKLEFATTETEVHHAEIGAGDGSSHAAESRVTFRRDRLRSACARS